MENGTLDCKAIAAELGGIGVPNAKVCDVVVVRQTPQITGARGLNQFTLMNSVLEFLVLPANATTRTTNVTGNLIESNVTTIDTCGNTSSMHDRDASSIIDDSIVGNATTTTAASQEVYVMGDFALLETEMNDVLTAVKKNGWTVTGIHNHMINETPKTTFMHWEAQ